MSTMHFAISEEEHTTCLSLHTKSTPGRSRVTYGSPKIQVLKCR